MKGLSIAAALAVWFVVLACTEERDQSGNEAPRSEEPRELTPGLDRTREEGEVQELEELLGATRGRLSAIDTAGMETDQRQRVEVLRNILREAEEALRAEDFTRARALAEKARVLLGDLSGAALPAETGAE